MERRETFGSYRNLNRLGSGLGILAGPVVEFTMIEIAKGKGVWKDLPPLENITQLYTYHPEHALILGISTALALFLSVGSARQLIIVERDFNASNKS